MFDFDLTVAGLMAVTVSSSYDLWHRIWLIGKEH